jgi:hypothetical protein
MDLSERINEEAAAARQTAQPAEAGAAPAWSGEFSSAAKQFLQSMRITYEMWHDGTGYNLDALAGASPAELPAIAKCLIEHRPRDWRDIEALAAIDLPEARSEIVQALHSSDGDVRREAMEYAAEPIDPKDRERNLVSALRSQRLFGGLSGAIDEAAEFHPPAVVQALLDGALHRDGDSAVNFAALLFFIHGMSKEPFDWDHRPFFLRFAATDPAARREAFLELCKTIGVDPAGTK